MLYLDNPTGGENDPEDRAPSGVFKIIPSRILLLAIYCSRSLSLSSWVIWVPVGLVSLHSFLLKQESIGLRIVCWFKLKFNVIWSPVSH
jgi:hypothetical protein